MNSKKPVVSIIVPLFNREDKIKETIESVKSQTFLDWELLVIDDHSLDGGYETVQKLSSFDSRIIPLERDKGIKGASACRNIGIENAQGEYLMFLDSDDLLAPACLHERVESINSRTVDFIVSQVGLFKEDQRQVTRLWSSLIHKDDIEAFIRFEGWCISSTFFRTSYVKKFKFDENAACLQDWGFHLNILMNSPKYIKLADSKPNVFIRTGHEGRISQTNTTNPDRVKSRFDVLINMESSLAKNGYQQLNPLLLRQYFQYLEHAAVEFSDIEFQKLYNLWRQSDSFNSNSVSAAKRFLILQNFLKKMRLRPLNSIVYRVFRKTLPSFLIEPIKRAVPLNLKIEISD